MQTESPRAAGGPARRLPTLRGFFAPSALGTPERLHAPGSALLVAETQDSEAFPPLPIRFWMQKREYFATSEPKPARSR